MSNYRVQLYPWAVIVVLFLKDVIELLVPFFDGHHNDIFSFYPVLEIGPQIMATFLALIMVIVPIPIIQYLLILFVIYGMLWIGIEGRRLLISDPRFHILDLVLNFIPPVLKLILLIPPPSWSSISILVPQEYDGDQPIPEGSKTKELTVNSYPYMLLILLYLTKIFTICGSIFFTKNINPWGPFVELGPQLIGLLLVLLLRSHAADALRIVVIVIAVFGIAFEAFILRYVVPIQHTRATETVIANIQGFTQYIGIIIICAIPMGVTRFALLRYKSFQEVMAVSPTPSTPPRYGAPSLNSPIRSLGSKGV